MKTMRDIELLSGVHPVIDFCLMQIKAGHIAETEALREMVVHLGANLKECQAELQRLHLGTTALKIEKLQTILAADALVIQNEPDPKLMQELKEITFTFDPGKPAPASEPMLEPLHPMPDIQPQAETRSERLRKLDLADEEISPRKVSADSKKKRGWRW